MRHVHETPLSSGSLGGTAVHFISLADFTQRLDFLKRSNIHEIRLIGGEPTLHPQFPDLIRLAQQRGKHIVIFTHGLIARRALTYTLPCGSPIPAGAVCTCNCVTAPPIESCSCDTVCTCDTVCSCVGASHYWYPN